MTVLVRKKYEVVHHTSNLLPIIGQLWSFTDFPLKWISVFLSKVNEAIKPLAFSSSNRTVTNRSKSWTKTCASSFICTFPVKVSTVIWFLDLLQVSISSELKSLLLSIFLAKFHATLLSRSASFLKTGCARISLMSFTFLDNSSRLPFSDRACHVSLFLHFRYWRGCLL